MLVRRVPITVLLIFGLVLSSHPGSADAQLDSPVYIPIRSNTLNRSVTYWTTERIKSAKPMPFPAPRLVTEQSQAKAPSSGTGWTLIANSGQPGESPQEQLVWSSQPPQDLAGPYGTPIEPLFATGKFAYTRYQLYPAKAYKKMPFKAVGRLLFTIPSQGDFICSAAVVNSANNAVVWTAAHCIATPNPPSAPTIHTNFVFVPGRLEGTNPVGSWTPIAAYAPNGWLNNGLYEYDLGALVMGRGGLANTRIGNTVGFLGFIADAQRQQHWHVVGIRAQPGTWHRRHQVLSSMQSTKRCALAHGARTTNRLG